MNEQNTEGASGKLKPCPFCGNDEPRKVFRDDESLWSHATVQWLHIHCDECDCESMDSEIHEEVIAAWNRRATEGASGDGVSGPVEAQRVMAVPEVRERVHALIGRANSDAALELIDAVLRGDGVGGGAK